MHDDEVVAGSPLRSVLWRLAAYLILWLVTSFAVLNYYHDVLATPHDEHDTSGHDIWAAAGSVWSGLQLSKASKALTWIVSDPPAPHAQPCPFLPATGGAKELEPLRAAIVRLCASVELRLHPPQTLHGSLLKILVVTLISGLWFYTFLMANHVKRGLLAWRDFRPAFDEQAFRQVSARTSVPVSAARQRWREGCVFNWVRKHARAIFGAVAIVPALVFAVAMHAAYEPAVFVMALAAIFVAAEHYGGLTETEHELKARTDALKGTMGRVLDADGMSEWRTEIYDLYRRAHNRVDAVIRNFDIDTEWWKCADSTTPWQEYGERCKLSSGGDTLLYAMANSEAKVSYVTDQPLDLLVALPVASRAQRKDFFRDLLGVAWSLVVFELAYEVRMQRLEARAPPSLRLKISRAPCWMHVVDERVFQIIERGKEGNSTVRQLTYSITDAKDKRALSGWARSSVRRFSQRGGRAEEYVFAALRYAALYVPCSEDQPVPLLALLDKLGMQDYLDEPKQDFLLAPYDDVDQRMNRSVLLSKPTAQDLCIAVFDKLLSLRLDRERAYIGAWGSQKCIKLKHLLSELV
ncbi:MAG: hypothetical protein AB1807_09945 [Pseudomonadota bacterium]